MGQKAIKQETYHKRKNLILSHIYYQVAAKAWMQTTSESHQDRQEVNSIHHWADIEWEIRLRMIYKYKGEGQYLTYKSQNWTILIFLIFFSDSLCGSGPVGKYEIYNKTATGNLIIRKASLIIRSAWPTQLLSGPWLIVSN